MSTSALFLAVTLVCAAAAGFLGGRAIPAFLVARSDGKKKKARPNIEELAQDSSFVFVSFAALGGILSVVFSIVCIVPALLLGALAAKRLPHVIEEKKARARGIQCEEHLDLLCDIVAMGMRAGLSFDASLELYCSRFNNPLAKRMNEARVQWTHGVTKRADALMALGDELESPSLKRFAGTVSQSVDHGAPLAGMLRRLAVELRQARKTRIERQVERAPVKMLVPTGVFILPAMLILVMGPMLLQFMGA